MQDYQRARPLYERARDIIKEALGERHPEYANILNSLGGLYRDIGDYRQARTLLERARDTYKAVLGEKHPHYAYSLNNLAGRT
jgi:tetratricopeptide (TPR) repeat protein